ncbi:MAG TPA: protein kinase [Pirellulales bacterium]|jgi:serine/threonine-protein kinase|nr:protein kinase [Pirellulales bacterium]
MSDERQRPTVATEQSIGEQSIEGVLDDICDRFEAACKSPAPPRLEDFVGRIPLSAADRGFRELLELELAYRRRAGETPAAEEYRTRFPDHAATIEDLFQAIPTQAAPARGPGSRPTVASPFADTIPARMADSFSDVVPADSQPGGTVGSEKRTVGTPTSSGMRFRVIRKHARGGLGEVFVAEDQELHREVALKQIQSQYADDVDSRSRFVLEAEVTGALEHPGIVPVYGLGIYPDGRPFYAMRFIRGDSLKDAIDAFHDIDTGPHGPGARELELRKLLGRFVDVCDAIEYAHSRGIVHRDLKPGNIMLGNFGETLVVDWGLAKQINQPEPNGASVKPATETRPMLLSGTAATRMGSAVGTPQYMSPEQAAGRLDLIGPRSDVYSLGATLYCLLTGKAPLSDNPGMDLTELLRRVKHGEIPPARAVYAGVPKGLNAICHKAMALRPEDRYPSARQLADDLEHWLADEPISAQPDTRTQLVARWIRRHRGLALATAIALLVVSLVSVVATVLVNHQREIADRLAVEKGELAEKEKAARSLAEEGFHEARGAVDDLFTKVSEDTLLNQPGMQGLRKDLLQKTLAYYERFLQQRADDPAVQDELSVDFYRAGKIIEDLDSPDKAIAYYQQARRLQEQLLAKLPGDLGRLNALGDTYNALGGALKKGQRHEDSLDMLEKAREIRQKLVALAPQDLGYERALANTIMNIGQVDGALNRFDEALKQLNAAQQIRRAHLADSGDTSKLHRDLAMGSYTLGVQELRLRHGDAARNDFADAIAELRQLIERDPRDLTLQYLLATCYRLAGDSVSQTAPNSAVQSYQQSLKAFTELVERNPDVSEYQSALAGVCMNMAARQHGAESLPSFEHARQILAELAKKYPENPRFMRDLAFTLQAMASRQIETGQFAAARAELESARSLLGEYVLAHPDDRDVRQKLDEAEASLKQLNGQHPSPPPAHQ